MRLRLTRPASRVGEPREDRGHDAVAMHAAEFVVIGLPHVVGKLAIASRRDQVACDERVMPLRVVNATARAAVDELPPGRVFVLAITTDTGRQREASLRTLHGSRGVFLRRRPPKAKAVADEEAAPTSFASAGSPLVALGVDIP